MSLQNDYDCLASSNIANTNKDSDHETIDIYWDKEDCVASVFQVRRISLPGKYLLSLS